MKNILKHFDYHDLIWLIVIAALPLILPKVGSANLMQYDWFVLGALIANYVNLFILGILLEWRFQNTGIVAGEDSDKLPGFLQAILNPAVMVLINLCFTVTMLTIWFAFHLQNGVAVTAIAFGLLVFFIVGQGVLMNVVRPEYSSRAEHIFDILRNLLSIPVIALGADLCRELMANFKVTVWDTNGIVMLIVTVVLIGPLSYIFLIFLPRAALTMKYPSPYWLVRYAIFIIAVLTNNQIIF